MDYRNDDERKRHEFDRGRRQEMTDDQNPVRPADPAEPGETGKSNTQTAASKDMQDAVEEEFTHMMASRIRKFNQDCADQKLVSDTTKREQLEVEKERNGLEMEKRKAYTSGHTEGLVEGLKQKEESMKKQMDEEIINVRIFEEKRRSKLHKRYRRAIEVIVAGFLILLLVL